MKPLLRLTSIILLFTISKSYGQNYEFNIGSVTPFGQFAYFVKPSITAEAGFGLGYNDSYYRFAMTLGYFALSPTQDTFRVYATSSSNSGNMVLPGWEVVHHYAELYLGIKNEFIPLPNKKVSPIIGLDIYVGIQSISEDDYYETIGYSSVSGDEEFLISLAPRIGVQYKLSDQIILCANEAMSLGFIGTVDESYWRTYIGIKYFPK